MKIFCIKSSKDEESFEIAKKLGCNVIELDINEEVDYIIDELVQNNCKTIILSNEVAGFSEDIIKKYKNNSKINIFIAPSKRNT